MIIPQQYVPVAVKTTAQDVTDAWANIGDIVMTKDAQAIQLWADVDINSSQNIRIRVVGMMSEAGTAYEPSVAGAFSSGVALVDKGYYEINADADQKIVLRVPLNKMFPFAQIQVQAGTVGATAGQIDSLYISVEK